MPYIDPIGSLIQYTDSFPKCSMYGRVTYIYQEYLDDIRRI